MKGKGPYVYRTESIPCCPRSQLEDDSMFERAPPKRSMWTLTIIKTQVLRRCSYIIGSHLRFLGA
jgi:hypothetical protein